MTFKGIMGDITNTLRHSKLGGTLSRRFSRGRPGMENRTDYMPSDSVSDASSNMPSGMTFNDESDLVLHTPGGEMPDSDRPPVDRSSIGESDSGASPGVTGDSPKKAA